MVVAGIGVITGIYGVYLQIYCVREAPPLSCGVLPPQIGIGFWSLPFLAIGYVIYRKGNSSYSIIKRSLVPISLFIGLLIVVVLLMKLTRWLIM